MSDRIEAGSIETEDAVTLEAEWRHAAQPRATAVLCHPHPQFGGTMRSIVISALFDALPGAGVSCLRFNFRGVAQSGGTHGEGTDERLDVEAAVSAMDSATGPDVPLLLVGWSFGADLALTTTSSRVAAWLAIAPPLRYGDPTRAGLDGRPKQLVLAEHDEFRAPGDVEAAVTTWAATEIEVVGGASHFFVGRTDQVSASARAFIDRVATRTR